MSDAELASALPSHFPLTLVRCGNLYAKLTGRTVIRASQKRKGESRHLVDPAVWPDVVQVAAVGHQTLLPFGMVLALRARALTATREFLSRDLTPLVLGAVVDPWAWRVMSEAEIWATIPQRQPLSSCPRPPHLSLYSQFHQRPGMPEKTRHGRWQVYPLAWADYVNFLTVVHQAGSFRTPLPLLIARRMPDRRQVLFEFLSREVDAPAASSADLTLAPAPATQADPEQSLALDLQRAQVHELELGVAALGLPVAPWMDEDHAGSSLEALAERHGQLVRQLLGRCAGQEARPLDTQGEREGEVELDAGRGHSGSGVGCPQVPAVTSAVSEEGALECPDVSATQVNGLTRGSGGEKVSGRRMLRLQRKRRE